MARQGGQALPKVLGDSKLPPPGLHTRLAPVALAFFLGYNISLIAYLVIRCLDLAQLPNLAQRGYSIAVLAVELCGIMALWPYAAANCRAVLPSREPERRTWADFGVKSEFDLFVVVPAYKEGWSTIKRTLMCATFARVPPGCRRHLILGNDGHDVAKDDPAFPNTSARPTLLSRLVADLRRMYPGKPAWFYNIYESRRPKARLDADGRPLQGAAKRIGGNAKSLNLNHCIKTVIPAILKQHHAMRGGDPANPRLCDFAEPVLRKSVVIVLDCDMAIQNDPNEFTCSGPPRNGDGLGFLAKVLRVLEDDRYDLVLTPQTFTNVEPYADAFNHLNPQFWNYILPGLTSLGYVACTGTNMGLRLSMLHAHSPLHERPGRDTPPPGCFAAGQSINSAMYEAAMRGPFPTYSVTEDYALSLELKKAGVRGTYHGEHLVRGAAPDGIKAVAIQRGRWTEGHWQIFFSLRNPWFSPFKLGLSGMLYYNYGTLAYAATLLTIWMYQLVPLLSAVGVQPVAFTDRFRYAATAYLLMTTACQYYVREAPHFFGMWRANMSNILLSWTYLQAIVRALVRVRSGFATHTQAEEAPEDPVQAQPPMPESKSESLVRETVSDLAGHLAYFCLLLAISAATLLVCVIETGKLGRMSSTLLLPATWAIYNAVGPALFLCAATLKRTKSLEMAMYFLSLVHTLMALLALISIWFVNSRLTIGFNAEQRA